MFQINSLALSCRIVGTPEYTTTRQDRSLIKLRVSQPTRVKDGSGEHQTKMMFFTALAFGPLADQINRQISEAQDLTIHGELKHREYTDRSNQRREVYEILIASFVPGLTREQRDQQPRPRATEPKPQPAPPQASDDPAPAQQRTFTPAAPAPDAEQPTSVPTFAPTYATDNSRDDPEPARTDLPAVTAEGTPAGDDGQGGLKLPW